MDPSSPVTNQRSSLNPRGVLHYSVFGRGFVLVSPRIPLKFSTLSSNVSQIKLLCQDTTKMLLCLWHLCSACQNHLFHLHFFRLDIHYLERRTVADLNFISGFDKVKNIASGGSEALFTGQNFAFFGHKAANSHTGEKSLICYKYCKSSS